jgi:hypothetical protein
VDGSHPSFVQDLPSSQPSAPPGTQVPFWHVSPTVHAEPSLHFNVSSAVNLHPLVGSQVSFVQGLPSSQLSGAPEVQVAPLQVSTPLHTFPSEQPVPGATAS